MEFTAVIVSDDEEFSNMILLEAEEMGINSIICRELSDSESISDINIIFADLDFCGNGILSEFVSSVTNMKKVTGENDMNIIDRKTDIPIIGWSCSDNMEEINDIYMCKAVFHRPFLMRNFRNAILDLIYEGDITSLNFDRNFKLASRSKIISENSNRNGRRIEALHKNDRITVSQSCREASYGDVKIRLSENEYTVLKLLCENRGMPVSREKILEVLGTDDGNIGDVYICHLRKKIDERFGLKFIYTVRGKGYMIKN